MVSGGGWLSDLGKALDKAIDKVKDALGSVHGDISGSISHEHCTSVTNSKGTLKKCETYSGKAETSGSAGRGSGKGDTEKVNDTLRKLPDILKSPHNEIMEYTKKVTLAFLTTLLILTIGMWAYVEYSNWKYERSNYGLFTTTIEEISYCKSNCGWKKLNRQTISFTGEILFENRTKTIATLKSILDENIRTVLLNSQGGDIETAITMAEILLKYNLNTVVNGVCLSACANYLFPAGKKRIINGVLGFHGGVVSLLDHEIKNNTDIPLSAESMIALREAVRKESQLNLKTGLKTELLIKSGLPDKGEGDGITRGLLFPTLAELKQYGLENIQGSQNEEIMCGYEKRRRTLFHIPVHRFVYHGNIDCSKYDWF